MKFLLTSYEYPDFQQAAYAREPKLSRRGYEEQLLSRTASGFLWADFYSKNLRKIGHEAEEILPTNVYLQAAWARENLPNVKTNEWKFVLRRGWVPWVRQSSRWLEHVVFEQIRRAKPDVLLIRDINDFSAKLLHEIRPYTGLIVGQHASPIAPTVPFDAYDLLLSSIPTYVDRFRTRGAKAELLALAFEPSVLDRIGSQERGVDVSFVGTVGGDHIARVRFLEQLCERIDLAIWGIISSPLPPRLAQVHRGPAWGVEMYRVLASSRITLNHHETWSGPYANNLRLYEGTGAGALLLTDAKENLESKFSPGQEILTYADPVECAEKAEYFLVHEAERAAIAARGQARTMRDHTYLQRMKELVAILRKYPPRSGSQRS
jgi:spore maturation protein CgeB